MLLVLAAGAANQQSHWASDRALWMHDTAVTPTSLRGQMNRASAAIEARDCVDGLAAWTHAVAALPTDRLASKLCPKLEQQGTWLIALCGVSVPSLACVR